MKRVMCGKMTMAYQNVQIGKSPGNVVYRVRPKGGGQQCSDGSPRTTNSYMVPANNMHSQPQGDATAAAAWNILAVSMYIRSQSPDSSSCLPLPPLPSSSPSITTPNSSAPPATTTITTTPTSTLTSSGLSSDAVDNLSLVSSCCTSASSSSSSLYSGQSSGGGGAPHHETRSSSSLWSSEEGGKSGSHLSLRTSDSIRTSFSESCCTDSSSSDEEKFSATHFERQPFNVRQSGGGGGAGGVGMAGVSAGDRLVESSGAHQDLPSGSPPMLPFKHMFQSAYARPNGAGGGLEMSSSSSSSIGGYEDSSCSSEEGSNEASGDMEVESPHRGGPLHRMDALEASLPIKKGLSRFWNGKAKSFSSLTDVLSIEQLAKPDNPYAKRRRANMSADRHKSFPPRARLSTAGISKRPTSTSGRNGLAVAVAMGSQLEEAPKHHHDDHHDDHHGRDHHYHSPPAAPSFPSSSRSLSLADLVQATSKAG